MYFVTGQNTTFLQSSKLDAMINVFYLSGHKRCRVDPEFSTETNLIAVEGANDHGTRFSFASILQSRLLWT